MSYPVQTVAALTAFLERFPGDQEIRVYGIAPCAVIVAVDQYSTVVGEFDMCRDNEVDGESNGV